MHYQDYPRSYKFFSETSYCYQKGRAIVSDPDDDRRESLSNDMVCDGNCKRCPEQCVISSVRGRRNK